MVDALQGSTSSITETSLPPNNPGAPDQAKVTIYTPKKLQQYVNINNIPKSIRAMFPDAKKIDIYLINTTCKDDYTIGLFTADIIIRINDGKPQTRQISCSGRVIPKAIIIRAGEIKKNTSPEAMVPLSQIPVTILGNKAIVSHVSNQDLLKAIIRGKFPDANNIEIQIKDITDEEYRNIGISRIEITVRINGGSPKKVQSCHKGLEDLSLAVYYILRDIK